jgi:ribose transport system ATP-binding protein
MASDQPVLRMEQIDKKFPGVHALDQVDFELYAGEVHILLGENGAGKSTLMKILSGSLPQDSGRIFVHGQEVSDLTPESAQALGIGMVYQEFSLVPALTVAENLFLGALPRNRLGLVDWPETLRRAEEKLSELGVSIDPRAEVRTLAVAEQQLTEITRVLAKDPSILLLDEPTSALSDAERERLFEIIRHLQERGVAIVHISHRLGEVGSIGQRVTVLRDGKRIDTLDVGAADQDRLITMMVGRKLTDHYPKHASTRGGRVLKVDRLSIPGVLHDLSFELHAGEVLGIFGLMGAGQNELARALFGLDPRTSSQVTIGEERVQIKDPADAIRHGLGFSPLDRREGLVPMLPIPPNVTLGQLSQYSPARLLNLRTEAETAGSYVRDLRIQPSALDRPVLYLSGGNQQKVVLSRWLCTGSKVLVLDDPTRGIDVGAKAEVFALMDQLTQEGAGVIFISSEMLELLAMADRILVMRDGRFTAAYPRGEATQEDLLRSAS